MSDEEFMRRAIDVSRERMLAGEGGPFGAVIVRGNQIIATGWNRVTSTNDPTAHAEVVAIRRACEAVGDFSLTGSTIYTSCEPCPMCLAAIHWARIDRIVFANTRADAARIGFDDAMIYDEIPKPIDQRLIPTEHMSVPEAGDVFEMWLRKVDKIAY